MAFLKKSIPEAPAPSTITLILRVGILIGTNAGEIGDINVSFRQQVVTLIAMLFTFPITDALIVQSLHILAFIGFLLKSNIVPPR
jgi:hypothetical protein